MTYFTQKKKHSSRVGGYTVIELVVAIGLFIVVALISSSAFLGVMSSNRKTLAVRTAMDNLSSAVESMSRTLKTGTSYHCETVPSGGSGTSIETAQDCPVGNYLAFEGQKGDSSLLNDQIIYRLSPAGACSGTKQICVSDDGGATYYALTAPELSVDGFSFRVSGSNVSDTKQPKVVIVVFGTAGIGLASSTFHIETTVSQRLPDLL